MTHNETLYQPTSNWMIGKGPEADVVISSRVRLARNLKEYPFPHALNEPQSGEVLEVVRAAADNHELKKLTGTLNFVKLDELEPTERHILVEKHLISPQHAENVKNRAVMLSDNEALSIMVNEEDHLRIQTLFPAFQLLEALDMANRVDDILEKTLDYSFCEQRGYLTACPTNVGTGLRGSVMLHLPGLVMGGHINNIITAISQLGLVVRGYYGEGTKALGQLFQVSNQITLGQSEEDIVKNIISVTRQIISQERAARKSLCENNSDRLEDKIFKSFGILSYARMLTSEEALNMLSDLRLGAALGLLKNLSQQDINELIVMIRPAFLQKMTEREMSPKERDLKRARIIRSKLEKIKDNQR